MSEAISPASARKASVRPSQTAKPAPAANAAPPRRGLNIAGTRATALVLSVVAAAAVGYAALRFARAVPATFPAPLPVAAPVATGTDAAPLARIESAAPTAAPREAVTPFVAPASASRVVRPAAAKPASEPKPSAPPEPTPTARFAAATEPPAPPPAVVPPPKPVARPDRWQLMSEAIAQCGREGFFAGVVCEQRVRLQYCEGYWGQAAQCPSGIPNDHGQ